MKTIRLPQLFDGAKFRTRYSLGIDDFFVRDGVLHYPDTLPDSPVFEAPDPPPKTIEERIRDLEAKTADIPLPTVGDL